MLVVPLMDQVVVFLKLELGHFCDTLVRSVGVGKHVAVAWLKVPLRFDRH